MKKLTIVLVTLMLVTTGCLWAQTHRHTDRSNVAAVESIANAAADTSAVEEVFGEFIGANDSDINLGTLHQDLPDEAIGSIAKVAIISVFGCLALIIIAPILVIALIIYLIVRSNNKNKGNSNEPVKEIPIEKATNDTTEKTAETMASAKPKTEKTKMERGIQKLAIGAGFALFGMWCNATPFAAVGFGFLIYGAGLICIDIFVDKK